MKENKKIEICVIIICLLIILPLFIISIYNRPSADDYDYAILTHEIIENNGNFFELIKAAWDTDISFYNTWQGLYSSAFLLALQPGIFGPQYYGLTILIVSAISYVCLLISLHILNKHFLKKSFLYSITTALIVLTIIMLWLPSAVQGMYWYNGAMNYIPFIFFTILNVSLLFEAMYSNNRKASIYICISTLLSFFISGGNHVTAFANILLLFILSIICIFKDNTKKRFFTLVPLVFACIGFLLVYIAPGTQIRQDLLEKQSIIKTILATIKYLRYIASEWISFIWMIFLILITPTAIEVAQKNREKFSKRFPIIPILVAGIVLSGMLCVPYFTMGYFGEGRLTNVIWISFMIFSWIIYFFIWGYIVKKQYVDVDKILNSKHIELFKLLLISGCMFVLLLFSNNNNASNSLIAIEELCNGVANAYSVEMDKRIEMYTDEKLTEVGVEPIKAKSRILYFSNDVTTDPNIWPNTSISKYYDKIIYLVEK